MQLSHEQTTKNPKSLRRRWGLLLARLVRTTHFDWEELESLCFVYHKLTRQTKGKMPADAFLDFLYAAFDLATETWILEFAVKNFDRDSTSYISMESWCRGMSIFLRGSLEEKIKFCFETFDMRREGVLRSRTLKWLVSQYEDPYEESMQSTLREALTCFKEDDSDGSVKLLNFFTAVHRTPNFLEFVGDILPPRPAVHAFLATFAPKLSTYM